MDLTADSIISRSYGTFVKLSYSFSSHRYNNAIKQRQRNARFRDGAFCRVNLIATSLTFIMTCTLKTGPCPVLGCADMSLSRQYYCNCTRQITVSIVASAEINRAEMNLLDLLDGCSGYLRDSRCNEVSHTYL